MLFSTKSIGLEICQEEARFALVGGKRGYPRLDACFMSPFPSETVRLSTKEPNVLNPSAFIAVVRDTYLRLLTDNKRVSVSLPDAIGRIMLLDLETRFKSKDEGRDIIRWKLKKSIPFDINEVHLDYQVLEEKETGEISTLVSLISRQVVTQFEELLLEAGLEANRIDFTTFNRYRLFAERLDLTANAAFITFFGKAVSILVFKSGILEFYRSKELAGGTMDADRVFREINSSLLVYREKYPGHVVNQAFCGASFEDLEILRSVVAEVTGLEPVSLDVERVLSRKNGLTADNRTLSLITAALGAATRNL